MRSNVIGIGAVLLLGLGLSACGEKPREVEVTASEPATPDLALVQSTPACKVREGMMLVTVRNDGRTTNSPVNTWVEAQFASGTKRTALPAIYPGQSQESEIELPAGCPSANCRVTLRIVEGAQQASVRVYDQMNATCVG